MTKRAFGELESQILYILNTKERMTVKDVHKALGSKDSYNTIMTVMSRLAEKKQLLRERVGLHYEYWLPEASSSFSFLDKIKQKFSGIGTKNLVTHLIESANDLTEEDLEEMKQLVERLRESKK